MILCWCLFGFRGVLDVSFIYCVASSLRYHSLCQLVCVCVPFILSFSGEMLLIMCFECGLMGIGDRVSECTVLISMGDIVNESDEIIHIGVVSSLYEGRSVSSLMFLLVWVYQYQRVIVRILPRGYLLLAGYQCHTVLCWFCPKDI